MLDSGFGDRSTRCAQPEQLAFGGERILIHPARDGKCSLRLCTQNPAVSVWLSAILGSVFPQRARMMLPGKEAHLQVASETGDLHRVSRWQKTRDLPHGL